MTDKVEKAEQELSAVLSKIRLNLELQLEEKKAAIEARAVDTFGKTDPDYMNVYGKAGNLAPDDRQRRRDEAALQRDLEAFFNQEAKRIAARLR